MEEIPQWYIAILFDYLVSNILGILKNLYEDLFLL